jgi:hypothetical protein
MLTSALRSGCLSAASVAAATQSRSPGVSSVAFRAQSPNLRFAPLMDMDFAVSCPLVRHSRLISGFCPSTRTFAPRFLQTSPRGDSPCVITSPSPPSGWAEDFHLQATEHAQHTTKPLRGSWIGHAAIESCLPESDVTLCRVIFSNSPSPRSLRTSSIAYLIGWFSNPSRGDSR